MVIEDRELLEEAADFLRALAHPVRLCIVRRLLREGSCNVSYAGLSGCAAVHRIAASEQTAAGGTDPWGAQWT